MIRTVYEPCQRVQHRVPLLCKVTHAHCEFFNMLTKEAFQLITSDRITWKNQIFLIEGE